MTARPPEEDLRKRVRKRHFDLLQEFGRNTLANRIGDKEKAVLWQMACKQGNLPFVPHDTVVDVWKDFVTANSNRSSLVVNGDVDPRMVSVGVAFDKNLVAGHTTTTRALLVRLLSIWRRAFPDADAFLEDVRRMAVEAVEPKKKKRSDPS